MTHADPPAPPLDLTSIFLGPKADNADVFERLLLEATLRASEYGRSAHPIVEALGFTAADHLAEGGVSVMRCTVMDPFLAERRGKVDFIEGFAVALRRILPEVLAEMA